MTQSKKTDDNHDDRFEVIGTMVRLGVLIWSGTILTLAYIKLPEFLRIPEQKFDNTFIASVFTSTLAGWGIQAGKNGGGKGVSKEELEAMIAASQAAKAEKPEEKPKP